jgi:hypothetical protein
MSEEESGMPKIQYLVNLTDDERHSLQQLLRRGTAKARTLTRARILLKADQHLPDDAIAAALDVSRATVERTRKRFVEENLDALHERPRPGGQCKLTDTQAAHLLAETRQPLPPKPSMPARYDYEYKRNGTRNLFMLYEPQAGWHHITITERRTKARLCVPDAVVGR